MLKNLSVRLVCRAAAAVAIVVPTTAGAAPAVDSAMIDGAATQFAKLMPQRFKPQQWGCVIETYDARHRIDGISVRITSRQGLRRARSLVREVNAAAFTTITVVSRRYSYGSITRVDAGVRRLLASHRRDVSIQRDPRPTSTRCPVMLVSILPGAGAEASNAVAHAQATYGNDRVRTLEVAPGQPFLT